MVFTLVEETRDEIVVEGKEKEAWIAIIENGKEIEDVTRKDLVLEKND